MNDRPNISSINPRLASLTCPPEMAEMKCWLWWRYESKPGQDKPAKVPYWTSGERRRGKQGSPEDRSKLVTFEVAQ